MLTVSQHRHEEDNDPDQRQGYRSTAPGRSAKGQDIVLKGESCKKPPQRTAIHVDLGRNLSPEHARPMSRPKRCGRAVHCQRGFRRRVDRWRSGSPAPVDGAADAETTPLDNRSTIRRAFAGQLVGARGRSPLVDFPGGITGGLPRGTTVRLAPQTRGSVVLMLKTVLREVMGFLACSSPRSVSRGRRGERLAFARLPHCPDLRQFTKADGQRAVNAEELVLRCGKHRSR
jgi:hypothetical protein